MGPVSYHYADTMHLIRANYQAAIWKCCLPARPTVPNPTKCGWRCDDGKLAIHWMRSPLAPYAVLELLACKRVRSCKLPKCTCMANVLACADMCKLQSCSSQKHQEDDIVELCDSDDDTCSMLAATTLLFNMFACESVPIYVI